MSDERERLVQARDEAWEEERVAWGALLGAKRAVDAAEKAVEEARVAHANQIEKRIAAESAVVFHDAKKQEGGR